MRLSEAIRLGAMMKPQAFECYEWNGRTCAMGAALEALGVNIDTCGVNGLTAFEQAYGLKLPPSVRSVAAKGPSRDESRTSTTSTAGAVSASRTGSNN